MIKDMSSLSVPERQSLLQHLVAPRPICLASTMDAAGNVNLSPFSFFNLFSSEPPILIFSPARRVRNATHKHTLENVLEVPEVVIHIVTYDMVQQVSLASCEYPRGINEFEKAGFTAVPATMVRPPMVLESPARMECRVLEVKPLGTQGGAGNLVICEVLRIHLDDSILDESGLPDQRRIQHVARLGGNWYCRVGVGNLFEVEKPNVKLGVGIDALPESIRHSSVLTGNHLGKLGNMHQLPEVDPSFNDPHVRQIFQYYSLNPEEMEREIHQYAARLLDEGRIEDAWQCLRQI